MFRDGAGANEHIVAWRQLSKMPSEDRKGNITGIQLSQPELVF